MCLVFSNKVITTWLERQIDERKQIITLTTESIEEYSVTCIILRGTGESQKTQFRETKKVNENELIFSVYLEMITERKA